MGLFLLMIFLNQIRKDLGINEKLNINVFSFLIVYLKPTKYFL